MIQEHGPSHRAGLEAIDPQHARELAFQRPAERTSSEEHQVPEPQPARQLGNELPTADDRALAMIADHPSEVASRERRRDPKRIGRSRDGLVHGPESRPPLPHPGRSARMRLPNACASPIRAAISSTTPSSLTVVGAIQKLSPRRISPAELNTGDFPGLEHLFQESLAGRVVRVAEQRPAHKPDRSGTREGDSDVGGAHQRALGHRNEE